VYPAVLVLVAAFCSGCGMGSENPSGADNQQERPGFAEWIVGFVDGEGCFSVPIFKNRSTRLGWQVQPSFTVVQGEKSLTALERLKHYFECGHIGLQARHDNHQNVCVVTRYDVSQICRR
jgi:LAGLIDADG endonuclease